MMQSKLYNQEASGMKESICVVGLGKAGLPLACVIADANLSVFGCDINKAHVEKLANKQNPIPEEPGVQEILNKTMEKNFHVTSDLSTIANVVTTFIIIVPLFIDERTKKADFSILNAACTSIAKCLKRGDLVVLETTVPPQTTETLIRETLETESGLHVGSDFSLAYSPERIMTGYSISRYKEFPKVVGGITSACTERAYAIYSTFCNQVVKVHNARTAELIKVAEGVYRDVNIALANELYMISELLNVDFWEMREHANHAFCHIHEPGNVGGHCIPVYPWFLINNHSLSTQLMHTARTLNDHMIQYYADQVDTIAKRKGTVCVIGLTYREGVKEKAYTRSIPLISELKQRGYEVFGYDPLYSPSEVQSIFNIPFLTISEIKHADAIVVMNREPALSGQLRLVKERVVDVKNILKRACSVENQRP